MQLEVLTTAFLDGIRKNAPGLEDLIITFYRVDETIVETLNSFQLEMKQKHEEYKTVEEKFLHQSHKLKKLTLIN